MQTLTIQHGVHVLHAGPIDQYIGCAVVTYRHHHGGQVAQGEPRDTGREPQHDVAAGDQVVLAHSVFIHQLELALLGLEVKLGQHCNFDGTGLGHDLVAIHEKLFPRGKIFDG